MTSHMSNVKYHVKGILTKRYLGYLSNLNRPYINTYLTTNKTSFVICVFTSSNNCLRDVNVNVLQSSQKSSVVARHNN